MAWHTILLEGDYWAFSTCVCDPRDHFVLQHSLVDPPVDLDTALHEDKGYFRSVPEHSGPNHDGCWLWTPEKKHAAPEEPLEGCGEAHDYFDS